MLVDCGEVKKSKENERIEEEKEMPASARRKHAGEFARSRNRDTLWSQRSTADCTSDRATARRGDTA